MCKLFRLREGKFFTMLLRSNSDLDRWESETDEEVGGPVRCDCDGGGHGPAGLAEELGYEEPGDGAGAGGEADHEADHHGDRDVLEPGHRVLKSKR